MRPSLASTVGLLVTLLYCVQVSAATAGTGMAYLFDITASSNRRCRFIVGPADYDLGSLGELW